MIHYDEDNIQFFEKKYSIEEIVQLYKENRLLFVRPRDYGYSQIYYDNNTTQLIKAIDMGMPSPPVYASEQQNGDMVVLEIDDKLYSLIRYVLGYDTINIDGEYYKGMRDFQSMQYNYRVLSSKILRTIVSFEIIDYSTPKYLHMFAGNFLYNWTVAQEHAVRKEIYKEYNLEELCQIRRYLYENRIGRGIRLTEYEILQSAAIWGIYNHEIKVDTTSKAQEQILMERTIFAMYKNYEYNNKYVNRAKMVLQSGIIEHILNNYRIKIINASSVKSKARAIIMGLSMCDNANYTKLLACMDNVEFIRDIRYSEITFQNVDKWLRYMYR